MKKDNLEDLFRDSFENFEADVNPTVWKNVQTALKGIGLGLIGKMLLNKLGSSAVISIVSSAAAVIATVFVMNGTGTKTNKTTPKEEAKPKVVAETVKPSVDEIKTFLAPEKVEVKENPVVAKNEVEPKNTSGTTFKKDKKEIEALLSDNRIASISSNLVAGAVPLILNLSNIGSGKINKWTFNDGTKAMTGANPVKFFDEPGIYTVILTSTSADGKTAVDSIKVEAFRNSSIVSNQREFSPNEDGVNDLFVFNSENIAKMHVTIYDKDAKVVYDFKGTGFKWDGKKQNGKNAESGTYLYLIAADGVDGKKYEQQGKIKLTR